MRRADRIGARPILAVLCLAPFLVAVSAPGRASADATALCGRRATTYDTFLREESRLSVGYSHRRQAVVFRDRQISASGRRFRLRLSCRFAPRGSTLLLLVGGLGDFVRVGGAGARSGSRAAPLPRAVQVTAVGAAGADRLVGHRGTDILKGGSGPDRLSGDGGQDVLRGGAGADRLRGGSGGDLVRGGRGSDAIDAADGEADVVKCGPGSDAVEADPEDRLTACEHITYL